MNKSDLIKRVAKQQRLPQRVVTDVIEASQRVITDKLRNGESVQLQGFGTFYTIERAGGRTRHLKTGELLTYAGRRIARFRVGAVLQRVVRGEKRTKRK